MVNFNRVIFAVLALTACVTLGGSGCGDNLTWSYSSGTLTISGTGKMTKFSSFSSTPWSSYRTSITKVVLKSGIERLGHHAFEGCSNLKSCQFPSTLKEIGDYTFAETGLSSASLPSSMKEIGDYAFYKCESLSSCSLSSNVKEIGVYCFSGSGISSVTIQRNVEKVSKGAFSGCKKLRSVTIYSGTPKIETSAFSGCSNLDSIDIPASVKTIESYAFSGCSKLSKATLSSVSSLGSYAFSGCSSLTSISIPSSITSIGIGVFYRSGLRSIKFPPTLTSIATNAFGECNSLTTLTIPSTLTSIANEAFDNCSSLSRVIIRGTTDPVKSGDDPFTLCVALKELCVFKSYETDHFGSRTVYPNSQDPALEPLFESENHCYEAMICSETSGILVQRENATNWINQINQCKDFYCDNETGGQSWHACNTSAASSMICVITECLKSSAVSTKGWALHIPLENATVEELDETEFLASVTKITGESGATLGTEIDDYGMLWSVYLIVNTEDLAYSMRGLLQNAIDDPSCNYGLLCQGGNITVIEKTHLDSGYSTHETLLILVIALMVSIISILN